MQERHPVRDGGGRSVDSEQRSCHFHVYYHYKIYNLAGRWRIILKITNVLSAEINCLVDMHIPVQYFLDCQSTQKEETPFLPYFVTIMSRISLQVSFMSWNFLRWSCLDSSVLLTCWQSGHLKLMITCFDWMWRAILDFWRARLLHTVHIQPSDLPSFLRRPFDMRSSSVYSSEYTTSARRGETPVSILMLASRETAS